MLWLYGPPGVGRTTVAWEMYSHLVQAGIDCDFVDVDQVGICYPEPARDPGRHRMKERNVDAVVAGFRAAGARCLIVSGVVDPAFGVHVDQIPHAAVTVFRLRADREVLRRRFTGRGGPADLADKVLRQADALDAGTFADACVDASGLPVNEVARRVGERTGGWPAPALGRSTDAPEPSAVTAVGRSSALAKAEHSGDLPVLWLCGATGVGKSSVGFELYQRVLGAAGASGHARTP
ncbi:MULTISPECIES: AAA family ATPase [unclassified Streptomyces]|uniref:AAA family ATPase n=1 Tax=unclassified Streptomyces TaxID=2593676 RepID=UPI0036EB6AB8